MKYLSFALAFLLASGSALAADFEDGMNAYDQQQYRKAFQEFNTLAEQGDPYAQYMLGRLYRWGNGTLQDYVQAHKWYNIAAARGHKHADDARDELAQLMSRRQIEKAQQLASQWQSGSAQDTAGGSDSSDDDDSYSRRELVRRTQAALNRLGYDAGPEDGLMGSRTRDAILDYQGDHNLTRTGEASRELLDHIEATQAQPQTSNRPQPAQPWPNVLVRDNFDDGDYTRNPNWQVVSGRFWVESGSGLRSVNEQLQRESRHLSGSGKEIGLAILQTVLEQTLEQQTGPSQARPAEIFLARNISNAFAINMRIDSRKNDGNLIIGPYQGGGRDLGYRLVYTPASEELALLRLSGSGNRVIASADRRVDLEDGASHRIRWTRDEDGNMSVSLDGDTVINTSDRSFRNDFRGIVMLNSGGDFSLNRIAVRGTD